MKKIVLMFIIVLLIGCSTKKAQDNTSKVEAMVLSKELLYNQEIGLFTANLDKDYRMGDIVEIEYTGGLAESYPAQLQDVKKIKYLKYDENKIVLVLRILNEQLMFEDNFKSNPFNIFFEVKGLDDKELNVVQFLVQRFLGSYEILEPQKDIYPDKILAPHKGLAVTIDVSDAEKFEARLSNPGKELIIKNGTYSKVDGVYEFKLMAAKERRLEAWSAPSVDDQLYFTVGKESFGAPYNKLQLLDKDNKPKSKEDVKVGEKIFLDIKDLSELNQLSTIFFTGEPSPMFDFTKDSLYQIENINGLEFTVENYSIDISKESTLKIKIRNITSQEIETGDFVAFEKFVDGKWKSQPVERAFDMVLYKIESNETKSFDYPLEVVLPLLNKNPNAQGKFRIIKPITFNEKEVHITAEFEVK